MVKGPSLAVLIQVIYALLVIEAESKHNMRGSDTWNSLTEIISSITTLLTVAHQIALILNLSRSTGGPI